MIYRYTKQEDKDMSFLSSWWKSNQNLRNCDEIDISKCTRRFLSDYWTEKAKYEGEIGFRFWICGKCDGLTEFISWIDMTDIRLILLAAIPSNLQITARSRLAIIAEPIVKITIPSCFLIIRDRNRPIVIRSTLNCYSWFNSTDCCWSDLKYNLISDCQQHQKVFYSK